MRSFDVFNGDADGICSLVQLRHVEPCTSTLVTGVKRDLSLLQRVDAKSGDRVTVLDVSLDVNRADLQRLLDRGVVIVYIDHHYAGEIPDSPCLRTHITTQAETCTALIVDGLLSGACRDWAVVGAYGDNIIARADALAQRLGWTEAQRDSAVELGRLLNYNSYGATLDDLRYAPAELYEICVQFDSPFELLAERAELRDELARGYAEDLGRARAVAPRHQDEHTAVYLLPDAPWARRASGEFGNLLAREAPGRAHAVLTERSDASYVVSVRAPLTDRRGAEELCRGFATGGGRAAAAGIQRLPESELARFTDAFRAAYSAP